MELVVARGTPYERGATIGRAMAASAARSVAFNRRYIEARGLDHEALDAILTPYIDASREALPHLVEQIRGMADGAGLPFRDVFLANAFEEVYGILELGTASPVALERCTDVVLRAPGRTLLGHTEQWYAGDEGTPIVVLDVPDDGPAMLAPGEPRAVLGRARRPGADRHHPEGEAAPAVRQAHDADLLSCL